jgi:hypothetical protein
MEFIPYQIVHTNHTAFIRRKIFPLFMIIMDMICVQAMNKVVVILFCISLLSAWSGRVKGTRQLIFH